MAITAGTSRPTAADSKLYFLLDIERGLVSGLSIARVFGKNTDVDASHPEDVWDVGGDYAFPTSASTLSIVSTNANDTSAGTGARTITVTGLNSSGASTTETVSLSGTTPVVTTGTFTRVNRMDVASTGSQGMNEGDITATHGVLTLARITSEENFSQQAIYSVPASKNAYLVNFYGGIAIGPSASGVKEGELDLVYRPSGGLFKRERKLYLGTRSNAMQYHIDDMVKFTAQTDIKLRFTAYENNTQVVGGLVLILETV